MSLMLKQLFLVTIFSIQMSASMFELFVYKNLSNLNVKGILRLFTHRLVD